MTMYGFLVNLVAVDLDGPLTRFAREHQTLVDYANRMHQEIFGSPAPARAA